MPKQKKKKTSDVEKTGEYKPADKVPLAAPAPLPPSPGEAPVEGWFDSQPTFADPRLSARRVSRETAEQDVGDLKSTRSGATGSSTRGLLMLVAAASLAVGMLIGALAFGHLVAGGADDCECAEPK